jgi:hypothetical protein
MIYIYIYVYIGDAAASQAHPTRPTEMMPWQGIVPYEARPQGARKGKANYAVTSLSKAKIEVQLFSKAFFIRRCAGDIPWDRAKNKSPCVSWRKSGSIENAWKNAKELSGWTEAKELSGSTSSD